jgi:hypothetical protein
MCCTKSEKEALTYIVPSKAHNWHSNFLKIVSDLTTIYKIGVRGEMSNRAETYAKDRAPYFQAPHH